MKLLCALLLHLRLRASVRGVGDDGATVNGARTAAAKQWMNPPPWYPLPV